MNSIVPGGNLPLFKSKKQEPKKNYLLLFKEK